MVGLGPLLLIESHVKETGRLLSICQQQGSAFDTVHMLKD